MMGMSNGEKSVEVGYLRVTQTYNGSVWITDTRTNRDLIHMTMAGMLSEKELENFARRQFKVMEIMEQRKRESSKGAIKL